MDNRKIGAEFEQEFCENLANRGFWVHNMANRREGQPADVIAVRNGQGHLIDCKVCSNDRFALSRIEDNQQFAMMLWQGMGNGEGYFALKLRNETYMISHYVMTSFINSGYGSLNANDICSVGTPLEKWVSQCK